MLYRQFWLFGIITILQGSVALHYLPKILAVFDIDETIASAPFALDMPFALHTVLSTLMLLLPGMVIYAADAVSIPLESLVSVWMRKFASHPAENALIVELYENMLKGGQSITEWDIDGDSTVANWEMEEGLKNAGIPRSQHKLIQHVLMPFPGEDGIPVSALTDRMQQLYFDIKEGERKLTNKNIFAKNEIDTKLTFVEIFNDLDKDDDGFITKDELYHMSTLGYFKKPITKQEAYDLFDEADILQLGRLNLFEFMSIMRKTTSVRLHKIGNGYLPLAWGSLATYWLGLGMQE